MLKKYKKILFGLLELFKTVYLESVSDHFYFHFFLNVENTQILRTFRKEICMFLYIFRALKVSIQSGIYVKLSEQNFILSFLRHNILNLLMFKYSNAYICRV